MNRKQRRREKQPLTTRASASPPLSVLLGLALASHRTGDLPSAERLYRQILGGTPRHPDALHFLGLIHYQRGDLDPAAELVRQSVELQPSSATFHSNFGMVLHAQRKLDEAAAHYRAALDLQPNFAEAHNNLGNVLLEQGALEEALTGYRQALRLQPDYIEARTNIGVVLVKQGLLNEGIAHYREALGTGVPHAPLHYNLGNALAAQDRHDEAIAEYHRALLVDPGYVNASMNTGVSLQATNRLDEAMTWYGRPLELEPDHPTAHFFLGMIHLLRGDLPAGWPHYEYRHRAHPEVTMRSFPQPQWRGEPLNGRTILLHWEQGLGDTLQFLRYVPMVQAAGGRVVVEVQPCLERLTRTMEPKFTLVADGSSPPSFDCWCSLMSLPLAFDTRLQTIPARVPYLRVPDEEAALAETLPWAEGLNVGLVWAGSPTHIRDRLRSLRLEQLTPLLEVPGIQFHSLQVGPATDQLSAFPTIRDLAPDPSNMADAAAKLMHLDLLIAADTSLVHLAGALGKPVWVLLPFAPDWRWLLDRADSPWYPTVRLFRQPTPGDWASVIASVRAELAELARHPPQRAAASELAFAAM